MDKYICPVCGYSKLSEPPYDLLNGAPSFNICPCCGCEFGYNDATPWAKENHRKKWIERGTPWFDPKYKPLDWNLREQLSRIGINLDTL
jgi:hypothetical protein